MRSKQHNSRKSSRLFGRIYQNILGHRVVFAIYSILCLLCLAVLVFSAVRGDHLGIFNTLLSLLLFLLPAFLEEQLHIRLSATLKIVTMLFIFSAHILGEVGMFYARIPFWDDLLHWVNGFLFAAFGFSLAEICNRSRRAVFHLSPFYLALVACCFSLSIGVLWEFLEFGIDMLAHSDMQKDTLIAVVSSGKFSDSGQTSVTLNNITQTVITTTNGESYTLDGYLDIGLLDTMKDLLVDFVGALIFSVIGYFHLKQTKPHPLADALIPKVPPLPVNSERHRKNDKKRARH